MTGPVDLDALQAENEALRQTLSVYQAIVAVMPLGLHLYHLEDLEDDSTLRMVGINEAASRLTGVPNETVLGKTLDESFPGLREQGVPQGYAQVVRTGQGFATESLSYGDDRILTSAFGFEAFSLPHHHVGILFENITERKRQEIALRESEARLNDLMRDLQIGIIVYDEYGRHLLCNPAASRLLGLTQDELEGRDLKDERWKVLDEHGHQVPIEAFPVTVAIETKEPVRNIVFGVQMPSGGLTWLLVDAIPIVEDGQPFQVICTFSDITERRRAEQLIREQADVLQELSTPLIPVSDEIVVMPLIGTLDNRRLQQVGEALLEGVVAHHADIAILDITGVSVIDTQIADGLLRAAKAVNLLGAQIMLTGIRAEVAQTLIGLGVDLAGMITLADLQSGIAEALRLRGLVLGSRT